MSKEINDQEKTSRQKAQKQKEQLSPMKKAIRTVSTVLLILSVLICTVIAANTVLNKNAGLFGYRLFYVITGSMEPTLPIGSTLIVHEQDSYEVGDIITFISNDPTIKGQPNTHRIIAIEQTDGRTYYVTKGDAVAAADDPIPAEDVLGKTVFCMDTSFLKNFIAMMGTPMGFFSVIVLPLLLVSVICLRDFKRALDDELKNAASEAEKQESQAEKEVAQEECQENESKGKDTTE